jgi:predicted negative regulator of RcsB-dependent stress response
MHRVLLPLALAGLLLAPALAPATDITFFDKKLGKDITVRKVNETESQSGFVIKGGISPPGVKLKFPITVSALDVRDVLLTPEDIVPLNYLDYRKPLAKVDIAALPTTKEPDRIVRLKESLPLFQELLANPKLAENARAARQVAYKYTQALQRLSQTDPSFRPRALEALKKFQGEHARGWQAVPALMQLAQLQEDAGDVTGVLKTYEDLAAVPDLSPDIVAASQISAARVLMKSDKFGDAAKKLQALKQKLPDSSPLALKVSVYLAQCQIMSDSPAEAKAAEQQIRTMLAATDDPALKALAHNTLGDYYAKQKRDEDAFWEYLRVDTLYGEDRFEHARALYHLARLFREVKKDPERARACLELLTTDGRFAGLEYQKKALKK